MFIGAIGLQRCFILAPRSVEGAFRLPTDLAGVTASFYDDQDQNLSDAVTSSCAKIKIAIKKIEAQIDKTESTNELQLLKQELNRAQAKIWDLGRAAQTAQEQAQQLHESIKAYFFSQAKIATPAEIKAWEDGAKVTHLKEVKILIRRKVYFVDRDVVVPSLYGAESISLIVASGTKVYSADKGNHNSIYYMDGFRTDSFV